MYRLLKLLKPSAAFFLFVILVACDSGSDGSSNNTASSSDFNGNWKSDWVLSFGSWHWVRSLGTTQQ